jgi:hypothetical protein
MNKKEPFWLSLSLINLCLVALLGFILRTKILFELPLIDFRNILSAHSHFAFAGWVGLALITLSIYRLLPEAVSSLKIYQWILAGIEISSLGMVLTFPFFGYNALSVFFSTLYVAAAVVFAIVFGKDIIRHSSDGVIKILSIGALISMMLSFLGAIGLTYLMLATKPVSHLYRNSIYTFLHFQYNGFFTLSVFAILYKYLKDKQGINYRYFRQFTIYLTASVIPALFLSLLWHNKTSFYVLGAIGCLFIFFALFYFTRFLFNNKLSQFFTTRVSRTFFTLSVLSFVLKMLLNAGTLYPRLANAVYGDRPVIIGFLHLVFLGFVSFFILSMMIEKGLFNRGKRLMPAPFLVFGTGIILNEVFLMAQGLGILLKTTNDIYRWLLWGAAAVLLSGSIMIASQRLLTFRREKSHELA